MKEITRIHIAKVPYDIEVLAKKDIETYIETLHAYANDDELLQDIEIRITELLHDRDVNKNGVITAADVAAVREKLGEPKDFVDQDDIVIDVDVAATGQPVRKLYRNIDSAVVGGVLSGIASFFQISPLWTRLLFIILLFASFGVALLVYIVLWIAIPAAKSSAEKLQMSGRPVTLASIREISENDTSLQNARERSRILRRVVVITAGILCIVAAIGAATATAMVPITAGVQFDGETMPTAFLVALGLCVASGILLTTLCIIGAYIAFTQKTTKRLLIAIVAIIVLGLASFGTAVGVVMYHSQQTNLAIQRNMTERQITLPDTFGAVNNITFDVEGAAVSYVVDDTPRIELHALPNVTPHYSIDGATATVSVERQDDSRWKYSYVQPTVTVYGPALAQLTVVSGSVDYQAQSQDKLSVHTNDGNSVSLGGSIKQLMAMTGDNSRIDAESAAVNSVDTQVGIGTNVVLGNIQTLIVTYSQVCPSSTQATVRVQNINNDTMTVNDKTVPSQTQHTVCGSVIIDEDENWRVD